MKYAPCTTDCVCCQVFQLQQEKKKLQEDFSSLLQNKEMLEKRCATIQREQTQLGPRLEETKWEVSGTTWQLELIWMDYMDFSVLQNSRWNRCKIKKTNMFWQSTLG